MDQASEQRVTQWVVLHGAAVRGYLLAMVRRVDVADDLLQEVFRRVWQAHHRYVEDGKARAFLLRVADRLVLDRHRSNHRELQIDDQQWSRCEPAGRDPLAAIEQEENQRQLFEALDQLSEVQRRVLLLRYYSDMTFPEIADTVNCPLSTALSHCRRGLLALRKILAEHPQ